MRGFGLLVCCVSACSSAPSVVPVEQNQLGITDVEVDRTIVDGNSLIVVRGLDFDGGEIAKAVVTMGRVLYHTDDAMEGKWIDNGTELEVELGGKTWGDTAPNRIAYSLWEPDDAQLSAFTRISAVHDAIERAGITVKARPPSNEVAYSLADCNGLTNLFRQGTPVASCCVNFYGADISSTWIRTSSTSLGNRTVDRACTNQDGSSCSGTGCYYGPCGGHMETVQSGNPVIFWPNDGTDWCGWDLDRYSTASTRWPYSWSSPANGSELTGITASCTCTQCVDGDPRDDGGNQCDHFGGY